jgi:hypothetical protein
LLSENDILGDVCFGVWICGGTLTLDHINFLVFEILRRAQTSHNWIPHLLPYNLRNWNNRKTLDTLGPKYRKEQRRKDYFWVKLVMQASDSKISSLFYPISFYLIINRKVIYFLSKQSWMCSAGGTSCGYCRFKGNVQRTSQLTCE